MVDHVLTMADRSVSFFYNALYGQEVVMNKKAYCVTVVFNSWPNSEAAIRGSLSTTDTRCQFVCTYSNNSDKRGQSTVATVHNRAMALGLRLYHFYQSTRGEYHVLYGSNLYSGDLLLETKHERYQ